MLLNSSFVTACLLFCILCQTVVAQSDFDAVRKQAMKSGSRQKAIDILVEFADAESTSARDEIRCLDFLARFCARYGNTQKADQFVKRAKRLAETADQRLLRNVLQIESVIANQLGDYERGIKAASRCIEISEDLDPDSAYIAKPLNERAINYACKNQFELAVADYQRALEIAVRTNDDKLRMHLLGNIASAFDELKLHEKSIEQNRSALELAKKFANHRCIARISANLANSYLAIEKYSEAKSHFQSAMEFAKKFGDHTVIGMVHTGHGDLEAIENRFDDARSHYEDALRSFKKIGDPVGVLQVQTRLHKLDTLQDKHDADVSKQCEELRAMLQTAEQNQRFHIAIDVIDQIVEKCQQQEDWEAMAELLARKIELKEKIWSESNQAAIRQLDNSRTELAQKQNYISILGAALTGLAALSLVLLILWRGKHLATKQLRERNVQLREGQQERTILERRLAKQEKVESLATMSAGLLHDFNNYLMAMISAAETGQLVNDVSKKNQLFESVLRSGMSASELTKSLSDYLGQGRQSNSVCHVGETILQGLPVWRDIVGDDIKIHYQSNDMIALVSMDRAQLDQIISNVIKNSSEAISQRGTIQIRLEKFDASDLKNVPGLPAMQDSVDGDTEYCQIIVSDDGVGMSAERVVRALDPYFSTKGIGRGLGLASANGIVERHDGRLIAQSEPNVGTEISIVLPMLERIGNGHSTITESFGTTEQTTESCDLRILLVEDEQSVGEGVKHYLQTHGIYVALANDANAALEMFRHESFDCVITDYMLPGLNGGDLAQTIKQTDQDLPIILISAYAADSLSNTGFFDSFLAKPFPLHQLLNSIHQVVGTRNRPKSGLA